MAVPEVLFVSKPVAPPWNDSNKNLVRDLAPALTRYRGRVMVPLGRPLAGAAVSETVYLRAGRFAPTKLDNAGVLARLLVGPAVGLWHLFFSPNPLTLRAARAAARARGARVVHTLCSAPDGLERVASELFADRIVALSRHTASRLDAVGVRAEVIPPALGPVEVSPERAAASRERHELAGAPYVLFAGDLEFGDGARTFLAAAARSHAARGGRLTWVIAARDKTERAREARAALRARAEAEGVPLRWLGEVPDVHALLAGAACVTLVTDTLHAKMDWPLVLLEALALGRPVLVARDGPSRDLVASGNAECVASGDDAALLARAEGLALGDPSELAARGLLGQRWVRESCAPSTVAAAYERVYDAARGV